MSRSFFRTYGFLGAMLLSIVLGCVLGALWPQAACLAPLGTIFINLMFCIVVPLVFCSLAGSIACMKSPRRAGKIMGTTLLVFVVTGLIASVIMIGLCTAIPLGHHGHSHASLSPGAQAVDGRSGGRC